MRNKTLKQLYTDHQGKVSDKWELYLAEYERIFKKYRSKRVKFLEIGVQNGGSLDILPKYFTNGKQFIGCDIDTRCSSLQYEDPRISIVVGDACNRDVKNRILDQCPEFDIVIDDGSHRSVDIIRAFANYFPIISDGGVFIVEDLHCSYWQEYGGGLFAPLSSVSFFKILADIINYDHWGLGNERTEIFSGFIEEYGIELNDETLCQIHSIEFINSLCIVKKNSHIKNKLGKRIVAGQDKDVVPSQKQLSNQDLLAPPQMGNKLSTLFSSPYQDLSKTKNEINEFKLKLSEQSKQVDDLKRSLRESHKEVEALKNTLTKTESQITTLLSSSSWRITEPLRYVSRLLIITKKIVSLIHYAKQIKGGYNALIKESIGVVKEEGFYKIRNLLWYTARNNYKEWIRCYDTLTNANRKTMHDLIKGFKNKPTIAIYMTTHNPNTEWLVETIESIRSQIYPNWLLYIADNASTDKSVGPILARYAREESRINVVFGEESQPISTLLNSALESAPGDYIALISQGDFLAEQALFRVVSTLNKNINSMLIYSDEDKIDELGERYDPFFKCDWSPELFYSCNIISQFTVYRAHLVRKVGGFREEFEGAHDYDLALRCIEQIDSEHIVHIPRVLYHKRVLEEGRTFSFNSKTDADLAGKCALIEHLRRRGVDAEVEVIKSGMYRVRYALPEIKPMVSIIIPTRNSLELIRRCIESILAKTTYENFEIIIVDNNSNDAESLLYIRDLQDSGQARVLRDERPFNYSALNNAAVNIANGELVCLLNNDIEVISPNWLDEMVSLALQPGVGTVGARLWYPDDTLQHAGVIVGLGGVAGHSHRHLSKGSPGYYSRAELIQNFSAVTAACLVIRKSIYQQVNGLNEEDLIVAYNDVDLCLKVQQAGYRNVWTPYAELYHHEYASRGNDDTPQKMARYKREVAYIKKTWDDIIKNDPYYNPNLTINYEDFSLSWPPRIEFIQDPVVKRNNISIHNTVDNDDFKPLVFVHIPKTAGTSFRVGLEEILGSEKICKDYKLNYSPCVINVREKEDFDVFLTEFKRIGYMAIIGHFKASKYANIFPLPFTATFLRDPIERVFSEFKHFKRNHNYKGTMEDFIRTRRNKNLQWEYLSKVSWQALGFVGISERYEESLELFEYLFGYKLPFFRSNIAPDTSRSINSISADQKKKIEKYNSKDIKLYSRVAQEFDTQFSMMKKNQPYTHSFIRLTSDGRLTGWAFRRESEEPVLLRLIIGGEEYKVLKAKDYNQTMHRHGCPRKGNVGFSVKLPADLKFSEFKCEVLDTRQCLNVSASN